MPEVGVQVIQDAINDVVPHLVQPAPPQTSIANSIDNALSVQKNPCLAKKQFRSRDRRVNLGLVIGAPACSVLPAHACDRIPVIYRYLVRNAMEFKQKLARIQDVTTLTQQPSVAS